MLRDPWSFLLLREALFGRRTFAEFRDELGIATDVLSDHLASLVEQGVLEKTPYREPGKRTRYAYVLTPAGEELKVVVAALQQWSEKHLPSATPSTVIPLTRDGQDRVRVTFVNEGGSTVEPGSVEFASSSSWTD